MISFTRQLPLVVYLLTFLFLQCVLIGFLSYGKNKVTKSYQKQFTLELANDYNYTLSNFHKLADFFFHAEIQQPAILALLEHALETDSTGRKELQGKLFKTLSPKYEIVKQTLKHIHFHLPDSTSFLRMHIPEFYGDNLNQTRESIRLISKEKRVLKGFEMGKHFSTIRYIYPLFNDEKNYLGSVEIGIAFEEFRRSLHNLAKGEYFQLINEDIVTKKLSIEGTQNFKRSTLNEHFFVERVNSEWNPKGEQERTNHIPLPVIEQINDRLSHQAEKQLQTGTAFSLTTRVTGQDFLISLLPVKNITNKAIGYLIWYSKDQNFTFIERGYILSYLIGTILIATILSLYRWSTNKIFKSHAEMEQIFNTAADGMRVVDKDRNVLRVNERFLKMSGLEEKDILSRKCYEVFGGASCMTKTCPLERIIHNKEEWIEKEAIKHFPNGNKIPCIITATPFRDSNNNIIGIIEDFKDISDRKNFEQQLERLARTDGLTGLLNRRGFLKRAERMLLLAKRQNHSLFLLFADLDNMKDINDSFGHAEGDSAIVETAKLLKETYRETDVIGRLGGDEFAVLLFDVIAEEKDVIANRLANNLAQWNEAKNKKYTLALSLGIIQSHPDSGEGIEALLQRADQAMYAVKKEKKGIAGK